MLSAFSKMCERVCVFFARTIAHARRKCIRVRSVDRKASLFISVSLV